MNVRGENTIFRTPRVPKNCNIYIYIYIYIFLCMYVYNIIVMFRHGESLIV